MYADHHQTNFFDVTRSVAAWTFCTLFFGIGVAVAFFVALL